MRTSNHLATGVYLTLLLLSVFLFSCVGPEPAGSSSTATGVTEAASLTVTGPAEAASPKYFSYTVRVSDKETQEPIQEAEVSIKLNLSEEAFGPMTTDSTGQVVFTFETDQAGQGIDLTVKAEGYLEQIFKRALKLDGPIEEVELPSLTTSTPTHTPTPTSTKTPSPSPTPDDTATSTPTPTKTPTVPSPTPEDTPTPTPTDTSTPTPSATPTITPTATPPDPTGSLAIPVQLNFGTIIYLTGFDGIGINGPNEVSIEGAEDARQPMFSRDGKSVMVKATIDGVVGLYKLTASGFNPEIVIKRGSAEWPVLSPDGETVMFSESTLDYRLHKRIPDPTKPPRTIDDGIINEISLNGFPVLAQNLLWSDDNRLVFQGCAVWKNLPSECGTWITNASNLDPQRIIVGNDAQPMSIRGGIFAYMQRETGKDWDIFIMSLDDGKVTEVTNNDFEDGLPAISPDGNAVAYISNESGRWGLWTVNLDGQNKKHWFDIDPAKGVFDTDEWNKERMSWRR